MPKTKIFCDIADSKAINKFNKKSIVNGFTTNPSLMRKAGAKSYEKYSKIWPNISEKKDALPDAENWAQSKNKIQALILD